MLTRGFVEALLIVPVVGLGYWYNRRLKEVKEARETDDKSPEAFTQRTELEARVTREGFWAFAAIVAYVGLLSLIL